MKTLQNTLLTISLSIFLTPYLQADHIDGDLTVRDNVEIATGSTDVELHLSLDGIVLFKGLWDGLDGLQAGDQGAGTRMLWYPGKGAFRVGRVTGTQWDEANIGDYSVAMGYNTSASGDSSVALRGWASGNNAIALGGSASGDSSIAMHGSANGAYAISMGNGATANGGSSLSIGVFSTAQGYHSLAAGQLAFADGDSAIAMGNNAGASGNDSIAMGNTSTASGEHSVALGRNSNASGISSLATSYSTAQAYNSVVIGRHNTQSGNSTTWVDTDPLFVIGNGSSVAVNDRSDALVVRKNGDTEINGKVKIQPGGDIPPFSP